MTAPEVSGPPAWIAVVGAFDRFNYGDVLFTAVARRLIETHLPGAALSFHGLRRIDMTALGGEATRPLSELFRAPARGRPAPDAVFVAGGDVLGARWADLAGHFLPPAAEAPYRALRRRLGEAGADRLARVVFRCPHLLPFVIDPRDFAGSPPPRVLYNAVGASNVPRNLSADAKRWLAGALGRAEWLSVRDEASRRILLDIGAPEAQVLPDSAVIMADLVPAEELARRRAAILARAGLPADAAYLTVQSADYLLAGHEGALADQLRLAHRRLGLPVIAFAIGRVPDHNDQVAARRLAGRLTGESWFHVNDDALAVADVMALIAGATAHMGTSLHGHITAFAFARPRVGLAPQVTKLTGFRDSWDLPETPAGTPFGEAAAALDAALALAPEAMAAQAAAASATYRAGAAAALARLLPAAGPGRGPTVIPMLTSSPAAAAPSSRG